MLLTSLVEACRHRATNDRSGQIPADHSQPVLGFHAPIPLSIVEGVLDDHDLDHGRTVF
jgi:ribosome assembly protein YihI (activator of Der GTPase)